MRVKIFVDFWNFQLAWNKFHGKEPVVKIPWNPLLYEVLVKSIDGTAVYAGTHVFASFDPLSKPDLRLRNFLNIMDSFPGYDASLHECRSLSPTRSLTFALFSNWPRRLQRSHPLSELAGFRVELLIARTCAGVSALNCERQCIALRCDLLVTLPHFLQPLPDRRRRRRLTSKPRKSKHRAPSYGSDTEPVSAVRSSSG